MVRRTRPSDEIAATARDAALTNVGRRHSRQNRLKPKDLMGIPWRVALALQADGWWLRQDNIWSKPNPTPESVGDRCTKAHEYLFLFSKSERYFFDATAVAEAAIYADSGRASRDKEDFVGKTAGQSQRAFRAIRETRNKRDVWTVASDGFVGEFCTACKSYYDGDELGALKTEKTKDGKKAIRRRWCRCGRHDAWLAHFAVFPPALIEPCVKAGTSEHGCCAACGAPWQRIVEVEYTSPGNRKTNGPRSAARSGQRPGFAVRMEKVVRTLRFDPTCRCKSDAVTPCTVLDPFGGAGTTALVASRFGRSAVLLELNPDYAEMSRQRVRKDCPLFAGEVG